ncbi:hypothetical protein TNCT_440641 [Trichonephila clavata]|uniref:Uncharacterized protein n=1 Tax=Trichonephila clavata TaxID=2740835 RepID=A0A8X6M0Z2_TRICU|nr:hypothetical protein TNCT_440641 [Trichonephila clavata]
MYYPPCGIAQTISTRTDPEILLHEVVKAGTSTLFNIPPNLQDFESYLATVSISEFFVHFIVESRDNVIDDKVLLPINI